MFKSEKKRIAEDYAKRNQLLEQQNAINSEANAIQLFSIDMDDVSKEYLNLLKQKKLRELRDSLGFPHQ